MIDFLFKFPTRSRPIKFKKVLDKYYNLLSGNNTYKFVISMDKDDHTMNNSRMMGYLKSKPNLDFYYRNNTTKIEAVNSDLEKYTDYKAIFLISDDMIVQSKNYDDTIVSDMKTYFPNYDGALHYNDGRVQERVCTLSIMGFRLYEYFGYIYHPDYKSLWCDNEYTEVTKQMRKIKYINRVIVKHVWPGANGDPLYRRNENLFARDKKMFEKRKSMGFPMEKVQ